MYLPFILPFKPFLSHTLLNLPLSNKNPFYAPLNAS
uniref:Uncharacterized protein n=1 Tax=Dulem virus 36 TaxID=3145754 RepID=A0AAU8AYA2_9CAUD